MQEAAIDGYTVFSDESSRTASRFRSMAAVSLESRYVVENSEKISKILETSGISEFSWRKLGGAKYRYGAEKLVAHVMDHMIPTGARVDVLIWDTQDDRHSVRRRDDTRNDERMFFHLHRQLMGRRAAGMGWHLRPDERVDMDWQTIRECLDNVGAWRQYFEAPLLAEAFTERFFEIRTMNEVESCTTPICQVADLFAGMGCFARRESVKLKQWLGEGQVDLFLKPQQPQLSNSEAERFSLIKKFYSLCRERRLGVSLQTAGYLETRDPRNSLNFWHYRPQHQADKAPTKDG